MLLKVWVAFALLTAVVHSQTFKPPKLNLTDSVLEEKIDALYGRLTVVEHIVENRTADVLKLKNLEEKFQALENHEIKNFSHRLEGLEGKVDTDAPQLDHLDSQVKKLWVEIRDIRNRSSLPNEHGRDAVPSKENGTLSHVEVSSREDVERKQAADSKDLIRDAIVNSTDELGEMLNDLKSAVRDTLHNSLHEMGNSTDEMRNELTNLELSIQDALSNYTDSFRSILTYNKKNYQDDLYYAGNRIKSRVREAFGRIKHAVRDNFKGLKHTMRGGLSNLKVEIDKSKDVTRKALINLDDFVNQVHCN